MLAAAADGRLFLLDPLALLRLGLGAVQVHLDEPDVLLEADLWELEISRR